MSRFGTRIRMLAVGVALVVLAVSAVGFTPREGPDDGNGGMGDGGHHGMMPGGGGYGMHQLPPALSFLGQIPADQRFDHFRGATVTVTDQKGAVQQVTMTPGTVTNVTTGANASVAITPNGQSTPQTFAVGADTLVRGKAAPGSLVAVKQGDKVVVVTVAPPGQSASTAAAIVEYVAPQQRPTPAPASPAATPAS